MKYHFLLQLSFAVIIAIIATSCLDMSGMFDSDEDNYPPSPPIENNTEILRVDIEPNPVVVGDSVQFTCIIKDSLDPAFKFQWHIMPSDTHWEETQENIFKVKAPNETGTYDGMVEVYNYDEPEKGVPFESFTYEVVEN